MFKLKNHLREWYRPQDIFVVRNPLLPVQTFFRWRSEQNNYLRIFYSEPVIQESIKIASPFLYEQVMHWLDDKLSEPEKKEKLELTLFKYMSRMSSRSTPYGLFASCSAGKFADESGILFKEDVLPIARPDMDFLCDLREQILKDPVVRNQLNFFPNSSLYRCGEQLRYIETRTGNEKARSYHLAEISSTTHLEKILSLALSGKKPPELANLIRDDEISTEDATEFVGELISSQLLVDELSPVLTGKNYSDHLLDKLKTLDHCEKYIRQIETTSALQVDCFRSADKCILNRKVTDEILRGVGLLQLLSSQQAAHDPFAEFKTAFIKRYNEEWIPLAEVLDPDWGIGYSLVANAGITESFKWQLYEQALREDQQEVSLDNKLPEPLPEKELNADGLPDSFSALVKIHAGSLEEIDNGRYSISLLSITGPSAANLLGRFCHMDPEIEELSRKIIEQEELNHPDAVYAEIVHLPEFKTGNILLRPALRKYEIPYLSQSLQNKEFRIPLSDLLIGVQSGKIMLRSIRLNKQVIPRLTTAHNYNLTTLPVYQFLCDLQNQGIRSIEWNWGALSDRPFLPRVRYGRFILSKARWKLTKADIQNEDFDSWRRQKKIPDLVQLVYGDNELLLDLNKDNCKRIIFSELNKEGSVILTEFDDTPEQCWIKSPSGDHCGELIIAFGKRPEKIEFDLISDHSGIHQKEIQRLFTPGSEWLYAKIYCGPKAAENLLQTVLKPLTEEWMATGLIQKFFFLRYNDDGHHIRIRFYNSNQKGFWKELISLFQDALQPFMNNRTVSNLQFETYQREIERYGTDTMEHSEDLFCEHSVMVLNFISRLEGDEGEHYRWQGSLKAVDMLLQDFNYTLEQKLNLISELNRSFSLEFKVGHEERKKMGAQFRAEKEMMQRLPDVVTVFENKTKKYLDTITSILNAASVQSSHAQLNNLMKSYIHLLINRLFIKDARKTELLVYEYLLKYYGSLLAKERKKKAVA